MKCQLAPEEGYLIVIDPRGIDEKDFPCQNEGTYYQFNNSNIVAVICPEHVEELNRPRWRKISKEEFDNIKNEDMVGQLMTL
jgi:predicted secreted protein